MALFGIGGDRPLFGGSQPAAPGAQPPAAPAAPSSTALMAQQTGATASSPFLQYLQQNAPAAKQTAQALMGEAPEPDYRSALIQAGLGILSQPGGQSPLQAIAKGAQTAMPLFLQEQERVNSYDQQVQNLAAKLNMGAAEFDAKMKGERKGVKCFDGVCIDEDSYQERLKQNGGNMEEAFDYAKVHEKRPTAQANASHLAKLRQHLEILKNKPDADPAQIKLAQDELEAMEAQIMGQDDKTITFGWMDENGSFRTASGPAPEVAKGIAQFNNVEQVKDLRTKQEATDQVLYYASNILDVYDKASVIAGGQLGGLASTGSAWAKALDEVMTGPRLSQFKEDVGDTPTKFTEKLRNDPEARNILGDSFLDKLDRIGADRAEALSNFYGLAYATARAEEPGGRLATSDVAAAMSSSGFDPEAMLNNPVAIKTGVMELAKRNLASYERAIDLADIPPEQKEAMKANDAVLNKRLKEYGFTWTGGPRGELAYDPLGDDENRQDNVSTTDITPPAPAVQDQGEAAQRDAQQAPAQIQSKEQYDQLPSGTRFVAPDGTIRVKP